MPVTTPCPSTVATPGLALAKVYALSLPFVVVAVMVMLLPTVTACGPVVAIAGAEVLVVGGALSLSSWAHPPASATQPSRTTTSDVADFMAGLLVGSIARWFGIRAWSRHRRCRRRGRCRTSSTAAGSPLAPTCRRDARPWDSRWWHRP